MVKVVNKNAKVSEYELPLRVESLEEGGYLAKSNVLQGVLTEGDTVSEAIANAIDVAANIIQIRKDKKLKIPLKILKRRSLRSFSTNVSVQIATI